MFYCLFHFFYYCYNYRSCSVACTFCCVLPNKYSITQPTRYRNGTEAEETELAAVGYTLHIYLIVGRRRRLTVDDLQRITTK